MEERSQPECIYLIFDKWDKINEYSLWFLVFMILEERVYKENERTTREDWKGADITEIDRIPLKMVKNSTRSFSEILDKWFQLIALVCS